METIQKIREGFAYIQASAKNSMTLKEQYYWIVKIDGMQGVAIEIPKDKKVNEKFANVSYFTKEYLIDGQDHHLLLLVCNQPKLYNDFVLICAGFLEKVLDAPSFQEIQKEPLTWWHVMKELIGNANIEKATYSVLAELLSYYYLCEKDENVSWNGPVGSSIDLESSSGGYEVKSTLARYGSEVTINSQYQMNADYLLFYRFEPADNGVSIQDVVNQLEDLGAEISSLEKMLEKMKYPLGSEIRLKSYQVLEATLYKVDEDFPKITLDSFVNGQLPPHVLGITYKIDLTGLVGETIPLSDFR